MSGSPAGSRTEILEADECWRYLRSSYIGRLAVINGSIPEIFPVNFFVLGEAVLFRTAPGTKLRVLLGAGIAALEADGLNPYGTEVWSVVAKGTPRPFEEQPGDPVPEDPQREPWEPGVKEHLICIRPDELTGRRFAVHPQTRWWPPLDFSADWL